MSYINFQKYLLLTVSVLLMYSAGAQSLKLMTYNIRLDVAVDGENDWNHRKDLFTSQIQFYEPDILGLQEATPKQVYYISARLVKYDHVGMGREGEGKGEATSIYYKKEKFTLIISHTFWLSATPEKFSKGWDAAYNRICTYALFADNNTAKKFWIFNTHLDNIGEVARTKGIQLILSKIYEVNTKRYPVIFMGDFNSEPTSPDIINLQKVMVDTRNASEEKPFGPDGSFNNFEYNTPAIKLIDYIFISKNNNIKVKKYAILTDAKNLRYPSDHFPVYAEIKLD